MTPRDCNCARCRGEPPDDDGFGDEDGPGDPRTQFVEWILRCRNNCLNFYMQYGHMPAAMRMINDGASSFTHPMYVATIAIANAYMRGEQDESMVIDAQGRVRCIEPYAARQFADSVCSMAIGWPESQQGRVGLIQDAYEEWANEVLDG